MIDYPLIYLISVVINFTRRYRLLLVMRTNIFGGSRQVHVMKGKKGNTY